MPEFLGPSEAAFEVGEARATIRLAMPAPADLHAFGWSALVQPTLVVADGPGEAGYLIGRLGEDGLDLAPEGWEDAITRDHGMTLVFSGDERFVPLAV